MQVNGIMPGAQITTTLLHNNTTNRNPKWRHKLTQWLYTNKHRWKIIHSVLWNVCKHTHTHTHMYAASLSHTHMHAASLTHTHARCLSHTHTHVRCLSLTHTHMHAASLTHTHTCTLPLSHTHTHARCLSHTHHQYYHRIYYHWWELPQVSLLSQQTHVFCRNKHKFYLWHLPQLFVFFFILACERIVINTHSTARRSVIGPENRFLGVVCASFSLEIVQAGAVKGLNTYCS